MRSFQEYYVNKALRFVQNKSLKNRSRHDIYNKRLTSVRERIVGDIEKYTAAKDALTYYDWWMKDCHVNMEKQSRNVIIFLNAEPESTVCPGFDLDVYPTLTLLEHVMSRLGSEFTYYVKEHPAMFSAYYKDSDEYLKNARSDYFRHMLERLNLKRLSNDSNAYDLIKKSSLIVAANGSISYEAVPKKTNRRYVIIMRIIFRFVYQS